MGIKKWKNRGITLISLIITIIVLLILAGITINLTIGEDGIITRAQEAGKNYIDAAEDERIQLGEFTNEMKNIIKDISNENNTVDNTSKPFVDLIESDGASLSKMLPSTYQDYGAGSNIFSKTYAQDKFILLRSGYFGYKFDKNVSVKVGVFVTDKHYYSMSGTIRFQYSDDGTNWIDCYTGTAITGNVSGNVTHVCNVVEDVGAHRYWRITSDSADGPEVFHVSMYGYE